MNWATTLETERLTSVKPLDRPIPLRSGQALRQGSGQAPQEWHEARGETIGAPNPPVSPSLIRSDTEGTARCAPTLPGADAPGYPQGIQLNAPQGYHSGKSRNPAPHNPYLDSESSSEWLSSFWISLEELFNIFPRQDASCAPWFWWLRCLRRCLRCL